MTSFPYLTLVLGKYAVDELQVTDPPGSGLRDKNAVIEELTDHDLKVLADAYTEIERRNDCKAISEWYYQQAGNPLAKNERRRMWLLFILFGGLADREIPPFRTRSVRFTQPARPPLDWTKLPESLRWIAPYAEKYGQYQYDDRIMDFLDSISA